MKHDVTKLMIYAIPAVAISLAATQALGEGTPQGRAVSGKQASSIGQPMRSLDKDMRVTRLIGAEVVGRDGRKIGEVEDLVIDTREGHVVHAILQSDEVLNPDEMMAVPLDSTHG
jgi:hypothetical protein